MSAPSYKLADIAAREREANALELPTPTPAQRAVLQAYWRARARNGYQPVDVKEVARTLLDDCVSWGIKREEVGPLLEELMVAGWELDLHGNGRRPKRPLRPKRPSMPKMPEPPAFPYKAPRLRKPHRKHWPKGHPPKYKV